MGQHDEESLFGVILANELTRDLAENPDPR